VREARRQRRLVDGRLTDWIVVRNRLSQLGSRNKKLVGDGINELARPKGSAASTALPSASSTASSSRAG
jgi:chromosome partitioning protein